MQTIGVAIPVPDPYGAQLRAKRASYGDDRADTIPSHITLIAPIEVPKARLQEFEQSLADLASYFPAYRMSLHGTGTFRPVSPVVFVALREGISVTEQLAKLIREVLELSPPRFDFHPHVTVAQEVSEEMLDRAFDELGDFRASWMVDTFSLFHHDEDTGWTTVRTYRLGG